MHFELLSPFWLLLAIPAFAVLYFCRTHLLLPDSLRAVTLILVLLALTGPRVLWLRDSGSLIVVADRSASMPPDAAARQKKVISRLAQDCPGSYHLGVVSFSDDPFVEKLPDGSAFEDFRGWHSGLASNISAAVERAVALVPSGENGRILLLSDGRWTGHSPFDSAALAAARGIAVDFQRIAAPVSRDTAVLSLLPPIMVDSGEAFHFSAEVFLPAASELEYSLRRGSVVVAQGRAQCLAGVRNLTFRDRILSAGAHTYELSIRTPSLSDSCLKNNYARAVTTVSGSKPMLILGNADSRFAALAAQAGIPAVRLDPLSIPLDSGTLSRFSSVVLENLPASALGSSQVMDALKLYVEQTGGALLMTGGRQSFGLGGYYASPLETILPVSLECRKQHRKLTNAVVIALDRSGSMSCTVPDGREKIALANQGAASVIELLSADDMVGVLAVDSQAHIVIPLAHVNPVSAPSMFAKIRSIQSMGGGIFVYEALNHAAQMLLNVKAGTRHIILFADASDAEEPGEYKTLLSKLQSEGITVSVIGMGSTRDSDAKLLMDVASCGGGEIYFAETAMDLPRVFAQDAVSILRNSFVKEITPVAMCEDFSLVASSSRSALPSIGGYNLAYLKPGASAGILTQDENHAPVMAFWSVGAGRVMAFTNEIDGAFSGPFAKGERSGEIYLSALRWLNQSAAGTDDPGLFIRSESRGDEAVISLELDPARSCDPFSGTPSLSLIFESSDLLRSRSIPMEWVDRDTLRAVVPVPDSFRCQVQCTIPSLRPGEQPRVLPCGTFTRIYPPEFKPELDFARGTRSLARMAQLSCGVERLNLNNIFSDIDKRTGAFPFWHLLAFLALLSLIAEIAVRRLGVPEHLPFARFLRRRPASPVPSSPPASSSARRPASDLPSVSAPVPSVPPPPAQDSLTGALDQAKKQGRKRF